MIRYVDTATENVTSIHPSRVAKFYSWASETLYILTYILTLGINHEPV